MARHTFAQMRSTVLRRIGDHPQLTAAKASAIIADVHRDIAVVYQWSQRRREALVQTVGLYTTGTVAVSNGSATILGTGTAWTAAMVGRQIALSAEMSPFFVGAVDVGLQAITLADAQGTSRLWGGESASLLTYRIFQSQYALPSDVGVVLGGVRQFPLDEKTRIDFDEKDPKRESTGEPSEWALVRSSINGTTPVETTYIEFWPVPDRFYEHRIPYLIEPPELADDAELPVCPPEPIEWRAAAEAAWYIYSKTGDARWDTLGKSYYSVYSGDESAGVPGVLMQCIRDDQHRFGLPQTLGGRDALIGYDRLSTRDWDAMH